MSNFSIQQPFILCSSCIKSSSHWRMLWNTVIYFVSNLHLCCLRMGQNSWSRREHKRKNTAAATGALLVRTVGETGFNFSLNANQLVCLTPNSCSPETLLQLVWCIAVWLVVKCFPILTTAYDRENFLLYNKELHIQFLQKGKKIRYWQCPNSCLHCALFSAYLRTLNSSFFKLDCSFLP